MRREGKRALFSSRALVKILFHVLELPENNKLYPLLHLSCARRVKSVIFQSKYNL